MYGHIDVEYALEKEDIYDLDFENLNKLFEESLEFLNYIMSKCADISIAYDNDTMCLRINRQFDVCEIK